MKITNALTISPVNDMNKTAGFYVEKLGFRCVTYLDAAQPHVCLYRDAIEIVLTRAEGDVIPNRIRYGYGEDAYLITAEQDSLQEEFRARGNIYVGVCIVMNSSLGMCAEQNAMANMITNGESEIRKVLIVMPNQSCGAPCGACARQSA